MPLSWAVGLGIANLVVMVLVAYFSAKRGVERGLEIGVAVHGAQIKELQEEVLRLRVRYHDRIAPMMTEHEMSIEMIKRKLGLA